MTRISEYISRMALEAGIGLAKVKNVRNQIKLSVAVATETSINIVLRTPRVRFYCPLFTHRKCHASYFLAVCIHALFITICYFTLQRTIYKLGVGLPVSLPLGETASELELYQNNWVDKVSYMITKAHAGEYTHTE